MAASEETKFYLSAIRPWELSINLVLYFMGAGLANYLGHGINWQDLWLGFVLLTSIIFGGSALAGCYQQIYQGHSLKKNVSNTLPGTVQFNGRRRLINCIALAIGGFGIALILTLQLLISTRISSQAYLFVALAAILIVLYSIPPIRLINHGLGEFIWAVEGAFLFPAVAFILQADQINLLLVFISMSLTIFYLAMELTRSLRPYSLDPVKYRQNTLVGRTGPERGLGLIIYLILAGFLLAALEGLFGLSWTVLWRILISLPIGIFLIWQLNQIRAGVKPNWRVLEVNAIALIVFPAYFISLLFWTG